MQGALRNAIASFIKVSPALKDTIWNFLEQYDLPVAVAPFSPIGQHGPLQVSPSFPIPIFHLYSGRYCLTV